MSSYIDGWQPLPPHDREGCTDEGCGNGYTCECVCHDDDWDWDEPTR